MPDVIKNKNTMKDQIPDVTYQSLLTPEQSVTQKGLDFKHANVVRVENAPGDVSVGPVKFKTVPGGRIVAVEGAIGPETIAQAGEDLSDKAGYAVMLLSDSKFYLLDSAADIAEKYRGFLVEGVAAGEQARVQSLGVATTYLTNMSPSEIYYGQDGTTDTSVATNGTSSVRVYNDGATDNRYHQRFTTSADIVRCTTIQVGLKKVSTPTGNLVIGIYAVSGSDPTGSALWSTSVDASTISTTATLYNYTVDLALDASTEYTIQFYDDDSGTMNSGAYVELGDFINTSSTPVYRQSSATGTPSWGNGANALAYIIRRGSGTIALTEGSYTKKVGTADTATKIDIIKN